MSNNTRGRKRPQNQQPRNRSYEWKSPVYRMASDICLGGSVLTILVVLLLNKNFELGIKIFSLAFLFFGLTEIFRGLDNLSAKGPKSTSVYSFVLGGLLILAGIAFFFFMALPYKAQ